MLKTDQANAALSKRDFIKAGTGCMCLLGAVGMIAAAPRTSAQTAQRGLIKTRRSEWFTDMGNGRLRCDLCPRECRLLPGQRGPCRVRENRGGKGYSLVYGNPSLVQLDPVERKPFFHVLPGSRALSVSTAGCNIECKFCEVWDMALVSPEEVHSFDMPPKEVVQQAKAAGARSISYAFGEPVVFFEYVSSIARQARQAGLLNLLHTNGFIAAAPLEAMVDDLDAVNIDLKCFDPDFYRDICGGELEPVLATLKRLKRHGVHVEITNIVIPTLNDRADTIRAMCRWIVDELGPDVPLHFGRFYPLYKLANLPPTPVRTLDRVRDIAREEGLRYVYIARVPGHEAESTFCPNCNRPVIERLGFVIEEMHLHDGACAHCGTAIPGRWA